MERRLTPVRLVSEWLVSTSRSGGEAPRCAPREHLLAALVEQAPTAIGAFDAAGNSLLTNARYRDLLERGLTSGDPAPEREVHLDDGSVHVVATSGDEAGARVLWKVERAEGDPGGAVRRLAATAIGSALGLDPADVRIARRPPVATFRDRRIELAVSMSHHGRFVAFACPLADPR